MKTELKWGLIFSLVTFLWVVLEFLVGLHGKYIHLHPYLTNLFVIPAVLMMYYAIREKRNVLGGRISFSQAFLCGLGVSVVVAVLSPLIQYVFHKFINPNYFANAIKFAVDNSKMPLEDASKYFNLQSYMVQASVGAIIAGIATSLILAALMRSKAS